eukprot:scaffold74539_cov31-Tisochrysis_lutea.AAC.2
MRCVSDGESGQCGALVFRSSAPIDGGACSNGVGGGMQSLHQARPTVNNTYPSYQRISRLGCDSVGDVRLSHRNVL